MSHTHSAASDSNCTRTPDLILIRSLHHRRTRGDTSSNRTSIEDGNTKRQGVRREPVAGCVEAHHEPVHIFCVLHWWQRLVIVSPPSTLSTLAKATFQRSCDEPRPLDGCNRTRGCSVVERGDRHSFASVHLRGRCKQPLMPTHRVPMDAAGDACHTAEQTDGSETRTPTIVSATELRAAMSRNEELVLCDIRSTSSFNKGHIRGAFSLACSSLHARRLARGKGHLRDLVSSESRSAFLSYLRRGTRIVMYDERSSAMAVHDTNPLQLFSRILQNHSTGHVQLLRGGFSKFVALASELCEKPTQPSSSQALQVCALLPLLRSQQALA